MIKQDLKSKTLTPWYTSPTARAFGALLIVLILGSIFNADNNFFKWDIHRDTLRSMSVYGILACGMTLVIISGGIDLAVGSVLAISSVSFALFTIHWGWPAYAAVPACMGIGVLCGATSGTLIAKAKMQPFIATLAMMVFARGLAKSITKGQKISQMIQNPDGTTRYVELPEIFGWIDTRVLNDNLSVVTIIFFVCVAISWFLLSKLRQGRYIYAIGGNEEAARLSGVPINWIKILTYSVSGLFCAIAGICQAAQETQGDPETGSSYELTAIAMVVIGGTSLNGGKGNMALTLIGILTIEYLGKILSLNAVGEDKRMMLTGVIIALAVLLQKSKSR